MGENKHSRHQAEAEKDSRFGVIALSSRSLHGDGDCALHSVLDGYNNLHSAGSMLK